MFHLFVLLLVLVQLHSIYHSKSNSLDYVILIVITVKINDVKLPCKINVFYYINFTNQICSQ